MSLPGRTHGLSPAQPTELGALNGCNQAHNYLWWQAHPALLIGMLLQPQVLWGCQLARLVAAVYHMPPGVCVSCSKGCTLG